MEGLAFVEGWLSWVVLVPGLLVVGLGFLCDRFALWLVFGVFGVLVSVLLVLDSGFPVGRFDVVFAG